MVDNKENAKHHLVTDSESESDSESEIDDGDLIDEIDQIDLIDGDLIDEIDLIDGNDGNDGNDENDLNDENESIDTMIQKIVEEQTVNGKMINENEMEKEKEREKDPDVKNYDPLILEKIQILCLNILNMIDLIDNVTNNNETGSSSRSKRMTSKSSGECECGSVRYLIAIMTTFFESKLPFDPLLIREMFHRIKTKRCGKCATNKTSPRIGLSKLLHVWCPGLVDQEIIKHCTEMINKDRFGNRDDDEKDYFNWALSCQGLSEPIIGSIIYTEHSVEKGEQLCQLCINSTTHYLKKCDHPVCKQCIVSHFHELIKNNRCRVCEAYGGKNKKDDYDEEPEPEARPRAKKVSAKKYKKYASSSSSSDSDY